MCKVEYLVQQVSREGLEANPKDLKVLTDLVCPGSLRSLCHFWGGLIKDYSIYTAVLYELREVDLLRRLIKVYGS
ncbi:Reverse transcriptase [Phytophthora palmivora]|uniref:Reverse transcriptase n=1 Tax=Phytophthora palmivora TaxID=4796 RepID=A0A2P4YKY7_9STRA|nr:Reverse transcriptase [Phytophthora palmivora]